MTKKNTEGKKKSAVSADTGTVEKAAVDVAALLKPFMERIEKLEKDNVMLLNATDRGRLENERKKTKKQPTPIVKITTYNGKIVAGWRMFLDEVYKDSDGGWHEKQIYEVIYEDDSKDTVSLVDFFRKRVKISAEVIKRNILNQEEMDEEEVKTRQENFKLRIIDEFKDARDRKAFKDLIGKEITIGGEFVN